MQELYQDGTPTEGEGVTEEALLLMVVALYVAEP